MRRLHNQPISGSQTQLAVAAVDNPGYGEPNRRYEVTGFNTAYNSAATMNGYPARFDSLQIFFHDDTRPGVPANGTTEQALMSILIDHLAGKQVGFGACQENQVAADYLAAAVQVLNNRDARTAFESAPTVPDYQFA